MSPGRILTELESLAAQGGLEVRAEVFAKGVLEGRGGLCWVNGRAVVVMDTRLSVPDRIAVLAAALARLQVDASGAPPFIREVIARARQKLGAVLSPKAKAASRHARPGLARAKRRQ